MLRKPKDICTFFKQRICLICQLKHPCDSQICRDCQLELPWLEEQCLTCALPLSSTNNHCPACLRTKPVFDRVYCAFRYAFPVNALIPPGKFNNRTDYLSALHQLALQSVSLAVKPDCLIPVPMHPRKLLKREYNHAWLLARDVNRKLNIPIRNDILHKRIHTRNQINLSAARRRQNLRHSFQCVNAPPPHVMLIDDVVTTGTTANILSRILKQAGCKRVEVFALARTDKPSGK